MRSKEGVAEHGVHWPQRWWILLFTPLTGLLCCDFPRRAAAESVWKTDAALERQLELPASINWGSNPLRPALANLARHQGVAIFLDRRVDPDQGVELISENLPLRHLLQDVANRLKLGVGRVGPVIYLGPPDTARVLGTVAALRAASESRLPGAVRARVAAARPLTWAELATPRELAERLAADAGLRVDGIERIPHDLWPAVDLPPLTFAQSMSLVLAGFHLAFDYASDGESIRLAPLPSEASITQRIAFRGTSAAAAAQIERQFPGVRFTIENAFVQIDSTIEVADAIRRLLEAPSVRPQQPVAKTKLEKRYTLRVREQPLAAVAAAIAKNCGVELRFDPRATEAQDQRVSLEVADVTLDHLLRSLLDQTGLTYRLDDQMLEIIPTDAPED